MACFIEGISVGFFWINCDMLSLSYLNWVGIVDICFRWLHLVIGFKSLNLEHPWFVWTRSVSVCGFIPYPSMSNALIINCIMTSVMAYPSILQLEGCIQLSWLVYESWLVCFLGGFHVCVFFFNSFSSCYLWQ